MRELQGSVIDDDYYEKNGIIIMKLMKDRSNNPYFFWTVPRFIETANIRAYSKLREELLKHREHIYEYDGVISADDIRIYLYTNSTNPALLVAALKACKDYNVGECIVWNYQEKTDEWAGQQFI